ncbi:MAG: beta-ketoacyl synthase N-terminal-like domain-containing protein [Planctomycetota bacterium]
MNRRTLITGLGPVNGLGLGRESLWDGLMAGRSALSPLTAFDPAGFDCRVAAQVPDGFKVRDYVPKTYRKATKVMARDIELAVAAAHLAALDAGLTTKATDPDATPSHHPDRVACHIGAGLIAADVDELTAAYAQARNDDGSFNINTWGEHGMHQLTPLWLLKYLPNMLACHVTITHDCRGPSNTVTCNETSAALSVGESLRVIQRGHADASFAGGAESKLNPMAYLRQQFTGRLNADHNDTPADAVRPMATDAAGTVIGEGGGILILEEAEAFNARNADGSSTAYAEIVGFGAGQTVHPATRNTTPDPEGRGIQVAIRSALRDADLTPDDIDLLVPFALGHADWDTPELHALLATLGQAKLADTPIASLKPNVGNTGAGTGALDLALAALALHHQTLPPSLNRQSPLPPLKPGHAEPIETELTHALVLSTGFGGQCTATILKRV